ncbi:unnamed protein product [Peronospora destructor]|uniref:Uncharacterized protein n=1 Tax=Peronospora destructor TaxID=86335 RepID=A0AAV0UQM7_9STRA|nr:unnamed protein product [Peronospora destructor]CAI5737935.1 unnamed protein product [Peronospora destructor]
MEQAKRPRTLRLAYAVSEPAIEWSKATSVCAARTTNEELNMVLDGQAFYLQAPKGDGYKVSDEVDDSILAALDVLEDVDLVDGECKD